MSHKIPKNTLNQKNNRFTELSKKGTLKSKDLLHLAYLLGRNAAIMDVKESKK